MSANEKQSANDRQVAGDHYKTDGKPEHWDLVIMYDWDYFQGQITKYIMRWRKKNGVEDLKKARHFLDKYIESAEAENRPDVALSEVERTAVEMSNLGDKFTRFLGLSNDSNSDENFQCEGYWGDNTQLYTCKGCHTRVRAKDLLGALIEHGNCPGKGYVAQG